MSFFRGVPAELGATGKFRPFQFPAEFDSGGWRLQLLEHSDGHCQRVVNTLSTRCIHRLPGPREGIGRSGL